MPHPTPRNHIRLKHSVGTRLQRAFRKTMLPPCTGRGAKVLLPDRGLLVLGDANLPRPCTVAGPGSPFPPPHNPLTDPPPPTLHHQFVPRLIPHFFQPHAPLAPPTPFSTTLGHALGPRTGAAHGGPRIADKPAMELSASRPSSSSSPSFSPTSTNEIAVDLHLLGRGHNRCHTISTSRPPQTATVTPRRCLARGRVSLNYSRWPRSPPTLARKPRVRRGSTGRHAAVPHEDSCRRSAQRPPHRQARDLDAVHNNPRAR